jgi:tetratricopeptide (TPR) repeat protein
MKTIRKSERSSRPSLRILVPILVPIVIAAAAIVAYIPAFKGGWIWDDDSSVYANPVVTRSDGLYRIWFTGEDYDFWPMTKTVFWIEWQNFGMDPRGYHVVNVLLHALGSVLVYFVLRRLRIPGAPLAGLIFALHPVNVASVAWIAELKNPLSMVFLGATVLCWLASENGRRRWVWYALSVVGFVLALTSKTSVVMLPVVLLGIAWWRRGKIARWDILRTVPFFALSVGMSVMTVLAQRSNLDALSVPLDGIYRLAGAGWTVWFYFYKALLPIGLSMIYPHWKATIESLGWIAFLPTAAVAAVLALLLVKRKTWWGRPLLFAFGYCLLAIFPVMGFFDMTITMHSLVADHFQYVPVVGVVALVCAGGWRLAGRSRGRVRPVLAALGLCAVVALGAGTWRRAKIISGKWKGAQIISGNESLWRDTTEKNGEAWMGWYNLGTVIALEQKGRMDEGRKLLQEAEELGRQSEALAAQGQHPQAQLYRQNAEARKRQGEAMIQTGKEHLRRAIPHYYKAIELKPLYTRPYNNLGLALDNLGRSEEGIEQYRKGVEVDREYYPNKRNSILVTNLGIALLKQNQLPEAAEAFKEAFDIQPRNDIAYKNGIIALRTLKRHDEVIELLNRKLAMDPNDPGPLQDLAVISYEQGKTDEAMRYLERSLELAPDNPLALMTRGDIMLATGHPQQAVESFSEAVQAQRRGGRGEDPKLLMKLAVAQTRAGRHTDALVNFLRILKAAPKSKQVAAAIRDLMQRLGHTPEAAKSYERALQVVPGWVEGLQKLSWIRSTHPDPGVRNSSQALATVNRLRARVGERSPAVMDTYAAALAEAGKFPEAVAAAKRALQLAKDTRDDPLAREIERRIELYSNNQAYREGK